MGVDLDALAEQLRQLGLENLKAGVADPQASWDAEEANEATFEPVVPPALGESTRKYAPDQPRGKTTQESRGGSFRAREGVPLSGGTPELQGIVRRVEERLPTSVRDYLTRHFRVEIGGMQPVRQVGDLSARLRGEVDAGVVRVLSDNPGEVERVALHEFGHIAAQVALSDMENTNFQQWQEFVNAVDRYGPSEYVRDVHSAGRRLHTDMGDTYFRADGTVGMALGSAGAVETFADLASRIFGITPRVAAVTLEIAAPREVVDAFSRIYWDHVDERHGGAIRRALAQKGGIGSGHHGHEGRQGRGSHPRRRPRTALHLFRRLLSKLRSDKRRRDGLKEDLDGILTGIDRNWGKAAAQLVARARRDRNASAIGGAADKAWSRILNRTNIEGAINDALTGTNAPEADVQRLQRMAGQWVDAYAAPMIERRLVPQLENALGALPEDATSEQVATAVEEVMGRVPGLAESVLQPLFHRLTVVSALLDARRAAKGDLSDEIDSEERYIIETAGDEDVCDTCDTISSISKQGIGLPVKGAVALLDEFLAATEEGDIEGEIDKVPFPTLDMVQGITRTELINLGYGLPGYHPACRCKPILV